MVDLKNKSLLVLGGTVASLDLVKEAKKLGAYVVVTDDRKTGVAKDLADESYLVSTTDMDGLKKIIEEKKIDGVFCGPSEFNLKNTMEICEYTNLPFYVTKDQWDLCSNKDTFKELCEKFDVPSVPGYHLTEECLPEDLEKMKYPVIIKPVDGASSRGLSVCWGEEELRAAIPLAIKNSPTRKFIVEKYITNDHGFGCKYIANDGEIYLTGTSDRYTVDTNGGKAMIINLAVYPSKKTDHFIEQINPNAIEMFKSIGIKNGSFFMQAIVDVDGQIYFHEMGLRLSGGVSYKMFEETCGFSDMEMMIRYSLGEKFASDEEIKKINPYFNGHYVGILCIPLREGKLKKISGVQEIQKDSMVFDWIQYYNEEDEIGAEKIGTLMQLFCRIKFFAKSKQELIEKIKWMQNTLQLEDEKGNDMIYRYFDTNRLNQ